MISIFTLSLIYILKYEDNFSNPEPIIAYPFWKKVLLKICFYVYFTLIFF